MIRGYCETCERLVVIVPREMRGAGRQAQWYPVPHSALDSGGPECPGARHAIQDHPEDLRRNGV